MELVEDYITHRQNTAAQYTATVLILEVCVEKERREGFQLLNQWWEQGGVDLAGDL